MVFTLITFDKESQIRSFSYQVNDFDTGLNILSTIAAQGNSILKADVIEDGQRTQLPPNAFDGERLSIALQKLQDQWQQLLSHPLNL